MILRFQTIFLKNRYLPHSQIRLENGGGLNRGGGLSMISTVNLNGKLVVTQIHDLRNHHCWCVSRMKHTVGV